MRDQGETLRKSLFNILVLPADAPGAAFAPGFLIFPLLGDAGFPTQASYPAARDANLPSLKLASR
jgi:hypothetical protein